jgi:hypothetical protein
MAVESEKGKQPNGLDKYNGRILKLFFTTNHQEVVYTILEAKISSKYSTRSSYPLEE